MSAPRYVGSAYRSIDGMRWSKPSSGPRVLFLAFALLLARECLASPLITSSSTSAHNSVSIGTNSQSPSQTSSVVTSPLPFPSNYPPPYTQSQQSDASRYTHQSLVSHILTCVYTLLVGIQLLFTSQYLEKVTLGNITSIYLSGIAWISLLNTDSNTATSSSSAQQSSMEDNPVGLGFPSIALILPIHVFGICLSVLALRINYFRQFAMMLTAASGGLFLAIQIVLLRHDLLIPLYFPDWLLVLAVTFASGLSLLWFRIAIMIVTPTLTGVFFISLGVDVIAHRDGGALMGLRVLLDHGIPTNMYQPDHTTLLTMGLFLLLIPLMIILHYRYGPQNDWPWIDRLSQQRESKMIIQRYTYLTYSQLSRSKSDVGSARTGERTFEGTRPMLRRPKSVYHKVKKRDISMPLEYVPPTSHFSRDSSDFAHY